MTLICEDGTRLTNDLASDDKSRAECLTEHEFDDLDLAPRPSLIAVYESDRKFMEVTEDEIDVIME